MNDFAAALDTAKVDSAPASKSSSMPTLDNAPENVKVAVDDLVGAKERMKKDGAVIKKSEVVIDEYVKPIQEKDGKAMRYSKSYEVVGNDETVKRVTQDRFTCNIKDKDNLIEVLGEKDFDEKFEINKSLTAKQTIFTDDDLQKKVMDALGNELFAELFEYKETLKTKKGFDINRFALDDDKRADVEVFVKQYKAAVKV